MINPQTIYPLLGAVVLSVGIEADGSTGEVHRVNLLVHSGDFGNGYAQMVTFHESAIEASLRDATEEDMAALNQEEYRNKYVKVRGREVAE